MIHILRELLKTLLAFVEPQAEMAMRAVGVGNLGYQSLPLVHHISSLVLHIITDPSHIFKPLVY